MSHESLIYRVNTTWDAAAIKQEIIEDFRGTHRTMWHNLLKLQEQGIREALIDLGWTPPETRPDSRKHLYEPNPDGSDSCKCGATMFADTHI